MYFVYSGYYPTNDNKYRQYSRHLQDSKNNDNDMLVTSLNLQELIFGIENKEYELYLIREGKERSTFTKKDFRKNIDFRQTVKSKINDVLLQIKEMHKLCSVEVKIGDLENFVRDYTKYLYDSMDYFTVVATKKKGIIYITDDRDFQSDNDIEILTI